MVGSIHLEEFATGLPSLVYPIFDLYGKCEKISIVSNNDAARNGTPIIEETAALEIENDTIEDASIPQCEKGDLEKETEQLQLNGNAAAASGSVM